MDARTAKMTELAVWFCRDANMGYDQGNRWDFPVVGDTVTPGECDCSSLVYHCAALAGFGVPISGTRYTGTMKRDFIAAGFKWHAFDTINKTPAGSILYKTGHTAIWTGEYIAEAYGDERNEARGGKTGDQNNETRLSKPRGGWEGYFYYPEPKQAPEWPQEAEKQVEAVDYIIEEGANNCPHGDDQQAYGYRWEKWASGKLVVIISDYFNGGTARNKYRGMYYLAKTLSFPEAPAFVEPPYIQLTARADTGWVYGVQVCELAKDEARFWVASPDKNFPRFSVDARVEGSWK